MTVLRHRLPYLIVLFALVLVAAVVAVAFWSLARSPRHFTLNTPFIKPITPKVRAGHAALFLVDYCKDDPDIASVGTVITRRGVVFPLGVWSSDLPLGCHKIAVAIEIPRYVPPQVYVLYFTREYRPTIFTTQGYSVSSEPFEVLPYDGSQPPLLPIPESYNSPNYDPPRGPDYER